MEFTSRIENEDDYGILLYDNSDEERCQQSKAAAVAMQRPVVLDSPLSIPPNHKRPSHTIDSHLSRVFASVRDFSIRLCFRALSSCNQSCHRSGLLPDPTFLFLDVASSRVFG